MKKILIVASNPQGTSRLRLDEEVREIDEGLQRSQFRERFDIESRWAPRPRDLHRALLDIRPQIVHFCGQSLATRSRLSGSISSYPGSKNQAWLGNTPIPHTIEERFGLKSSQS